MSLRCERQGESLYVLPSIVYGEPPRARVEGDRLIALEGDVPFRVLDRERELAEILTRELGLKVGRGEEFSQDDAVEVVKKLERWGGRIKGCERGSKLPPPDGSGWRSGSVSNRALAYGGS